MYATLNHLARDGNWTIDDLNREQVKTLLPTIFCIGVMIVIGTCGNSIVIYIHYTRFRRSSYRFYVMLLAFCDVIMCTVGMPFLIYDALHPYTFSYVFVCKTLRLLCYVISLFSIFTLTLIAIERYRKICMPLKSQISLRFAKRLSLYVSGLFAFILSVPSLVIYGLEKIPTGVENIYGHACFTDMSVKGTMLPLGFNIFLIVIICILGCIMIYCYTCIRLAIGKRSKSLKEDKRQLSAVKDQMTQTLTDDATHTSSTDYSPEIDGRKVDKSDASGVDVEASPPRLHYNRKKKYVNKSIAKLPFIKRRASVSAKTCVMNRYNVQLTKILLLVSTVYSISFIPHLVLMMVVIADDTFLSRMNVLQSGIFYLFLRSFLLNSVANPFIYGSMDKKFRQELKALFMRKNKCAMPAKDMTLLASIARSSTDNRGGCNSLFQLKNKDSVLTAALKS